MLSENQIKELLDWERLRIDYNDRCVWLLEKILELEND